MKKIFLILILIATTQLFAEITYSKERKTILQQRLEKELEQYKFRLIVAKNKFISEQKILKRRLLVLAKLKAFKKSSIFMKKQCFSFDFKCLKVYDMTILYLNDEIKKAEKLLKISLANFKEAKEDFQTTEKNVKTLSKGIELKENNIKKAEIPGMKKMYKCLKISGWNLKRGIFVSANEHFDLPETATVEKIITFDNKTFVTVKFHKKYYINYAYAGKLKVKKNQKISPYTELFLGSKNNPLRKNSVIIFIMKNNKIVDPTFMCK